MLIDSLPDASTAVITTLFAPDRSGLKEAGHGVWRAPPLKEHEIDEEPELVGPEVKEREFADVTPPSDTAVPPELNE